MPSGRSRRSSIGFTSYPGARVVLANYALLQQDFPYLRDKSLVAAVPELRRLKGKARQRAIRQWLDRWLVCNAGFISRHQKRPN